jgi:hypothetical protein
MYRHFIDQLMNHSTLAALAYIALVPKWTAPSLDAKITAFIGIQTVIFLCAVAGLCGLRIPPWINWVGFAINFAWITVLTVYFLTFTMRLF